MMTLIKNPPTKPRHRWDWIDMVGIVSLAVTVGALTAVILMEVF